MWLSVCTCIIFNPNQHWLSSIAWRILSHYWTTPKFGVVSNSCCQDTKCLIVKKEGGKIYIGNTSNNKVLATPAVLCPLTMNDAFFLWNPEFLGLSRQIGQINLGSFRVFSADLSAPIFAHEFTHLLTYMYLDCVRRSSWSAITLDTLIPMRAA